MKNKIIVKNLCMDYKRLKVLDNISFDIKESEFVSIVGPSGCGKTTLLYLIQGFIKQKKGIIRTYGKKGFVFQDHNLFPWKTIKENIGISQNVDIYPILEHIGLNNFKDYYPNQVSEGMKQRAGIGRCLAYNSDILLMDEPFGSLDYLIKIQVQKFLLRLWKVKRLTVLFITHDIDEAIRLSNRVIVLSKLPARIVEIVEIDHRNTDKMRERILNIFSKEGIY